MAAQSKASEDIIKFSKFPAAQAPDPNEIPKIEMDHWPGAPLLAAVGMHPMLLSQTDTYISRRVQNELLKACKEMSQRHVRKVYRPRGRAVKRMSMA